MQWHYLHQGEVSTVVINRTDEGFEAIIGEETHRVTVLRQDQGILWLQIDGYQHRVAVATDKSTRLVKVLGADQVALKQVESSRAASDEDAEADRLLTANTPAQVVRLEAAVGQAVEEGQILVVLEAMKMEFRLSAPRAGVIKSVMCEAGQVVERGQPLVELE
ncbi:MAG: hypothetical protein KC561_07710 [Myxococcales bacterium]|nr:hypothetical protein [Myxococcales bacterium]